MTITAQRSALAVPAFPTDVPSKRRILKGTGAALFVATVIFFIVVLPAEYGIDPLHTGAALGVLSLSKAGGAAPVTASAAQSAAGAEVPAPVITGTFVAQPPAYKIDSRELKLQDGEGIEIKYHMQAKAGMVYSWTASNKILYEFHGEPDLKPAGAPADYFESYDKDDKVGVTQYHGSFNAPSTGIQGWFWDNESGGPITIKLVTAGFYDYILQNKDDVRTRLQPKDPQGP